MQKIAILGFGLEGKSVLKFLKKDKKKKEIWILDSNEKIKLPRDTNISFQLGKNYLDNLDDFDVVFRSPGIPYNLSQIQKAIKNGVEFSSATKLFFKEAQKIKFKIIGVTGTKGKGTTSTLIYKILRARQSPGDGGKTAYLARPERSRGVYLIGNIGKACLDIVSKLNKNSIVVFELSSFQLQDLDSSPNIAVILDIFPDHLDKHKTFKEYFSAKLNIVINQRLSDKVFCFSDNFYSQEMAQKSKAQKIIVEIKDSVLFEKEDLKIRGPHNFKNILMAVEVTKSFKIDEAIIKKVVLNFHGLPHRLEFVGKINGISFYNDSAATNPESTAMAIKSFSAPQILIMGGKDKNLNYSILAKTIKKSSVKKVFIFGENKDKINKKIAPAISTENCVDLKSALEKSFKIAYNGDIILFSPGSASFDMFRDYKDRGEQFKKLVNELK